MGNKDLDYYINHLPIESGEMLQNGKVVSEVLDENIAEIERMLPHLSPGDYFDEKYSRVQLYRGLQDLLKHHEELIKCLKSDKSEQ